MQQADIVERSKLVVQPDFLRSEGSTPPRLVTEKVALMLLGSRVLAVLVHRCAQLGDLQEVDGALPELILDRNAGDLREPRAVGPVIEHSTI